MKIAAAPVNNTTNSSGKRFQGRLNTDKLGSFMQTLIRNYNNPELATLREWVSNAHDAHIQAGQTRPIRVTLPSKLSPSLTVEDWGIGMSYEDVENTYAVLLTSTKDLDNDGIGGFGIGGKSALAIADQYTMVTIKDGLKNIFIFERSDQGGLDVKNVLENAPTDEPNGVKVTVAVSGAHSSFDNQNLSAVLGGWRPSELEVIGGNWTSHYENSIELEDGFIPDNIFDGISENVNYGYGYGRRQNNIRLMVGPVAYTLPNRAAHGISNEFSSLLYAINGPLTVKIPIGDVTVPSSREVIEDNDLNASVIIEVIERFQKQIQAQVDAKVKNLSSIEEAYKFATSNFAQQSKISVNYEGRDLTKVSYNYQHKFAVQLTQTRTYNRRTGQYDTSPQIMKLVTADFPHDKNLVHSSKVAIVVHIEKDDNSFTVDTYRKYLRSHVTQWLIDNPTKVNQALNNGVTLILTQKLDDLMPVTSTVWKYAELRKTAVIAPKTSVKLSEQQRIARVNELRAYSYSAGGVEREVTVGELELKPGVEPIVLIHSPGVSHYVVALRALFSIEDRLVVVKTKKSFESMKRVYTEAILIEDYLENLSKKDRAKAIAFFEKTNKLSESLAIDPSALVVIDQLAQEDLLSSEAKGFLLSPEVRLASTFSSLWHRPYGNVSTVNYDAFMKFVGDDVKQLRVQRYRKLSGPFSLAVWDRTQDEKELAEYLNWSAERRLSATKS